MEDEEKCEVCNAHDDFEMLTEAGIPSDEAFHDIFTELAYSLIEDITDIGYSKGLSEGYDEGYKNALKSVIEQSEMTLKMVQNLNPEESEDSLEDTDEEDEDLMEFLEIMRIVNEEEYGEYPVASDFESNDLPYYEDRDIKFVDEGDFADWLEERM